MDREAIFLEVKYDDLYHCLISKDHGKVYVQLTKKAVSSSGVSMPGPSHQKPKVKRDISMFFIELLCFLFKKCILLENIFSYAEEGYNAWAF